MRLGWVFAVKCDGHKVVPRSYLRVLQNTGENTARRRTVVNVNSTLRAHVLLLTSLLSFKTCKTYMTHHLVCALIPVRYLKGGYPVAFAVMAFCPFYLAASVCAI